MINQETITQLNKLTRDYLAENRLQLIELIHRYEGSGLVLRLLVDKPEGGITLGECALLNRKIGDILDQQDSLAGHYILEVSSPGLDRLLKTREDFMRCLNKQAVFLLKDLVSGKLEWQGLINRVSETAVFIARPGESLELPLIKINKAKLVI